MTIGSENYDYVIGIDAHAIINTRTGGIAACMTFPVTIHGMNRAITCIQRNAQGQCISVVEETRSYGATITHALNEHHVEVVGAKPPRRKET